jgi:hypothetical protein
MNSEEHPITHETQSLRSEGLDTSDSAPQSPSELEIAGVTGLLDRSEVQLAQEDAYKVLRTTQVGLKKGDEASTLQYSKATRLGAYEEREAWNGVVLKRDGDEVWVRLKDPKGKKEDEEAALSMKDLASFDTDLIKAGAPFYWSVGSWKSIIGSKHLISNIRFQRLPKWTELDIERSKARVEELKKLFEHRVSE